MWDCQISHDFDVGPQLIQLVRIEAMVKNLRVETHTPRYDSAEVRAVKCNVHEMLSTM